jgi:hypothetical protein
MYVLLNRVPCSLERRESYPEKETDREGAEAQDNVFQHARFGAVAEAVLFPNENA